MTTVQYRPDASNGTVRSTTYSTAIMALRISQDIKAPRLRSGCFCLVVSQQAWLFQNQEECSFDIGGATSLASDVAERVRFELTVPLRERRISSPVP